MKRTATLITVSMSALFLALVPHAFSQSKTTVNVQSNTGGNTICQNGKCTTTSNSGNSTSHVCVNGKCFDSGDGDVNYESEDGNTKVNINSNNDASVKVEQKVTGTVKNTVNVTSDAADINPTMKQEVQGIKDEVQAKKKELEEKKFDLMKYIENEFALIKKLFSFDFLFGKKE